MKLAKYEKDKKPLGGFVVFAALALGVFLATPKMENPIYGGVATVLFSAFALIFLVDYFGKPKKLVN
jgi:hypothetical protein